MKRQTTTIKDIARELGISPSTVSRALKDHFEISEETKKAVKRVAEELNYQPNSLALSLRNSKSNTIGVVIPEIVHFFFSTVISGIEDIAHANGYNVIITQSNESYDRELSNIQTLFNSRVDGMLISISKETFDCTHINELKEKGLPVVFFDRIGDDGSSSVTIDDFQSGYQATKHLIQQGYDRIAHLAGPSNLFIMNERLNGYKQALEDAGYEVDEQLIIRDSAFEEEAAYDSAYKLLNEKNPNGIFAYHDLAAMAAIKAVQDYGKNVPQDVGVVGFSNWQFTKLTNPTITTVEQPGYEIGQKAAEMLLKQIEVEEESGPIERIKLKTKLIARDSTKKH